MANRQSTSTLKRALLSTGSALAVMLVGVSVDTIGVRQARAQQPATADGVIEEIVVKGTRASLKAALEEKRNAIGVVDGIVAEDIGKFPDLNVSESLQRITGITINRTVAGEGNTVSLRGLPPEFVAVTLNGMTATSGNAGREFDFDVFASELFSKVKVSKTPSAELTEGGLAGTIDLRTPRPLDFDGDRALFSASGQYAELGRGKTRPRVSGLYSWQSKDAEVGLLASASYSESTIRNDTKQGFRFETLRSNSGLDELVAQRLATGAAMPSVTVNGRTINTAPELLRLADNTAFAILPRVGVDIKDRERLGVTTALQFRPNDNLELAIDVLHAQFEERGERHTIDGAPGFSGTASVPVSLTVKNDGAVDYAVVGTFNGVQQRSESVDEKFSSYLWHTTAEARYRINDQWSLHGEAGYSKANEDELRRTYLYFRTGAFTYDLTDPRWPKFSGAGFNYSNVADYTTPDRPRFRPFTRDDRNYTGRFDVERQFDDGPLNAVKAGFEYTDRRKRNTQFLETRPTTTVPFTSVFGSLPVSDFGKGAPEGFVRNFLVTDLAKGRANLLPDTFFAIAGPDLRGSWVVSEKVLGGYAQSDWSAEVAGTPVDVNLGVRFARTDQTSDGHQQIGTRFDPISEDNKYTDVLPSLSLRWSLTDELVARLAANKAITRPTLSQLSAGTTIGSTNQLTASKGNPKLAPFRAHQFDVALEWYFAEESLLSATGFYKDMKSFVVNSTIRQVITGPNLLNDAGQNVSGREFTVTLPINGTGGELYGAEIGYQQPFNFLPSPFDGLGASANITLSHSKGTTVQGGRPIEQALQGQSDLSYNVILYYEKGPVGVRAAYSHRGDYADQFRNDVWPSGVPHTLYVDQRQQLDLSFRYQVNDSLSMFLDAVNVTSENYYSYDTQPGMSRDYFEQGPVYNFGVRMQF